MLDWNSNWDLRNLKRKLIYHKNLCVKSTGSKTENERIINLIDKVLETGDLNVLSDQNKPLIFYVSNDLAILLLKNGANPNILDNNKCSLLMHAASMGYILFAEQLLDYGADPDLKDKDGLKASDHAYRSGRDYFAEWIKKYESGGLEELKSKLEKRKRYAQLIKKFLKTNNIDIFDEDGNTMIMYAVSFCDVDLVISLLENGANPNHINYEKKTPLMLAYETNNLELLEILCGYGADFHLINLEGKDLMNIAKNDKNKEALEIFESIYNSWDDSDTKRKLKRKYLNKYGYIK